MKDENKIMMTGIIAIAIIAAVTIVHCFDSRKDRKSTRLNSSHSQQSRMPSSA